MSVVGTSAAASAHMYKGRIARIGDERTAKEVGYLDEEFATLTAGPGYTFVPPGARLVVSDEHYINDMWHALDHLLAGEVVLPMANPFRRKHTSAAVNLTWSCRHGRGRTDQHCIVCAQLYSKIVNT